MGVSGVQRAGRAAYRYCNSARKPCSTGTGSGQHGNGDNRARPATAGSAVTEARPGRRIFGDEPRNVRSFEQAVRRQRDQGKFAAQQHAVVIGDPILAKDLFSTSTDLIERAACGAGTIGAAFGPASTFSLAGKEHLERRRLLAPPFHSKRMRSYDLIIEEEVMPEIATWPEGREFEMLAPMLRITCGAILRAVFGAEGPVLDELRDMVPALVTFGSFLVVLPPALRRDLGPWSPYGRYLRYRRRFDAIIDSLIADARAHLGRSAGPHAAPEDFGARDQRRRSTRAG